MRNKHFFCLFLFSINSFIYPQEQSEQLINDEIPNINPILLEKNGFFSFYPYRLTDGTQLNYKNTMALLKSIPDNEYLIKQQKRLQIINGILIFAGGGGSFYGFQYYFRNNNIMMENICFSTLIVSCLTSFTIQAIRDEKINKAINNYNLSVMGLPIPTKENKKK
jgi:hypothetical protein